MSSEGRNVLACLVFLDGNDLVCTGWPKHLAHFLYSL